MTALRPVARGWSEAPRGAFEAFDGLRERGESARGAVFTVRPGRAWGVASGWTRNASRCTCFTGIPPRIALQALPHVGLWGKVSRRAATASASIQKVSCFAGRSFKAAAALQGPAISSHFGLQRSPCKGHLKPKVTQGPTDSMARARHLQRALEPKGTRKSRFENTSGFSRDPSFRKASLMQRRNRRLAKLHPLEWKACHSSSRTYQDHDRQAHRRSDGGNDRSDSHAVAEGVPPRFGMWTETCKSNRKTQTFTKIVIMIGPGRRDLHRLSRAQASKATSPKVNKGSLSQRSKVGTSEFKQI